MIIAGPNLDPKENLAFMQDWCAHSSVPCRHDVHIVLPGQRKPAIDETLALATPMLAPAAPNTHFGIVLLFPGDKVNVEAELHGDEIHLTRVVEKIEHPERTFVFDFRVRQGSLDLMVLMLQNPFERTVKFDLGVLYSEDESNHMRPSSSCPLRPHIVGFESWPNPIYSVVIMEPRFLPNGSTAACE